MIKKIFKKILGVGAEADVEAKESLRESANKLQIFFEEKVNFVKAEYQLIRKKLENLQDTNYQQGLRYLDRGHVRDAIWRFRIVIKFWPDHLDAYYQLAYALVLNNKLIQAKKVLEDFLAHNPNYDQKAYDLLERVNKSLSDAA